MSSENKKVLGPPTGYVDILLTDMERKHKQDYDNNKQFQKTPIRPSAVGSCARELYFALREFAGMEKYPYAPKTGEEMLLLDLGHAIEAHLVKKFRYDFSLADVKYTQQSLEFARVEAVNNTNLSQHIEGSLDLCLFSDKYKVVADVKSKGDYYDFKARKSNWDATSDKLARMSSVQRLTDRTFWVDNLDDFLVELADPFFEANFRQLNMYANAAFLKDRGVDHGAIIQYMKTKSKLREIRFRPSTTVYNQSIQKLANVIRAVDENNPSLAPNEYTIDDFKTKYCNACKAGVPGSCVMMNKPVQIEKIKKGKVA
jgi:hypothetical protein